MKFPSQDPNMIWQTVLHFRPIQWFFRRNWYALRWGIEGCFPKEKIYLIDVGAVTFGLSYQNNWKEEKVIDFSGAM